MQNSERVFADSNIWLYALIRGQAPEKTPVAQAIIANPNTLLSTQVIAEICNNLIRKAGFSEVQIRELVTAIFQQRIVIPVSREVFLSASRLRERHGFAYWDGLMVAAALQSDAAIFYSEDMHSGLIIEGKMRIVNPFTAKQQTS